LGIDASDVVTRDAVFTSANLDGEVYGALKVVSNIITGINRAVIYLSGKAVQGTEYHEAFHYVSRLLLNDKTRTEMYKDYTSKHPEMEGVEDRAIEEALAEEFRKYMLDVNNVSVLYKIKKIFNSLLKALHIIKNNQYSNPIFDKIRNKEFVSHKPS